MSIFFCKASLALLIAQSIIFTSCLVLSALCALFYVFYNKKCIYRCFTDCNLVLFVVENTFNQEDKIFASWLRTNANSRLKKLYYVTYFLHPTIALCIHLKAICKKKLFLVQSGLLCKKCARPRCSSKIDIFLHVLG